MVSTTDRYASEVGLLVLRAGGNAVDAVVAATFALAVVNPEAGNLAGGSFLLTRAADGSVSSLDARSKAPGRATRSMFVEGGEVGERSVLGHLSAAVPGAVAGLWEAHRRLGSRPWSDLVEPAIDLADGFVVEERFAASFPPHIVEGLRRFPQSAAVFLPRKEQGLPVPAAVGDTFRQPDLARTLARIRDHGADGFYRGQTADLIVREMERGKGILGHRDLSGYETAWREPVRFDYRGYEILSMPPSSSGGTTLAGTASILDAVKLGGLPWHGPEHVHLLAEAWRRAFVDRNHHLADPDFVDVPILELVSKAYGRDRARTITRAGATPSDAIHAASFGPETPDLSDPSRAPRGGGVLRSEGTDTTHVSIVDPGGGAASLTTTLNTWYGSKLVVEGGGFLLNNEMDDFSVVPGKPNYFGLVQGEANAIEPGKRMLSAMTPTIVLDPRGELCMVLGTPGGPTIITTVFQVISNVIDHGMTLAEAVEAPRVHHQHLPDRIESEPGGLPSGVTERLSGLGHTVQEDKEVWGDVQAIASTPDGRWIGVADPRRGGTARGM